MEFIEVEVHKEKKSVQEKSSLIQRIENNVNNVTTPQRSLIQRIENNVNNGSTPQRPMNAMPPNQINKFPNFINHTPHQQIVGTVKNMQPVRQLKVIYFCFSIKL